MEDEILDTNQMNPDAWDSKKRIAVSDAIIEVNDNLRRMLMGHWVLIGLVLFNIFALYVTYNTIYEGIAPNNGSAYGTDPAVVAGAIKIVLITAVFTLLPFLILSVIFRKKPVLCLGLALGFYLAGQVFTLFSAGGWAVAQGYGVKAAIITALAVPLYCGIRWQKSLKSLREIGYSSSLIKNARKKLKPLPRLRKKKK